MGWSKTLLKGSKLLAKELMPEAVELGAKIGTELYEQQKALVKIPDLKDVHVDEAMRILKDELHMIPTSAIANPNVAYADESDNEVMYSEPRFGSKVSPGTPIKIYYINQEVIDKSKHLLANVVQEFKVPLVVGLNVYEAREDLEGLGLRVADKLEKANASFAEKEDGQVTRLTYPNDVKVGSKLKSGERVWLYYVNEEVILESKLILAKKQQDKQELLDMVGSVTKDVTSGIASGAVDATKNLTQIIGKRLAKDNSKKEE